LYAKGMTTREIVATFKEMYDADVSPTLISKVTDAVKEQVTEWQNRPLDALYPIVYLDCIVVKVRHNGSVINKAVFLALGINTEGQKELLGMWLAENEGAKFWLSVLTEHLGHEKNTPKSGSNTRNGYSSKTLLCDDGEIELNTPRDRENTFEPQLIKKNQTRITQMDSQILSLYAKGMT
ncbi:transposase, partial [Yersinia pestis]|uniref:transposase n=1 Tax=Yersinia pestis TaxID=632 RepID=UPI001EE42E86